MAHYKLDDKTIGQIAKCVQLAILTGTDIVDHLRQLQLTVDEEEKVVTCTKEYIAVFESNIHKMMEILPEKKPAPEKSEYEQITLFD
tara:strand:+ start:98 stop:358 length:261 start_codon:yes stop_codon:yes gene_type:complete